MICQILLKYYYLKWCKKSIQYFTIWVKKLLAKTAKTNTRRPSRHLYLAKPVTVATIASTSNIKHNFSQMPAYLICKSEVISWKFEKQSRDYREGRRTWNIFYPCFKHIAEVLLISTLLLKSSTVEKISDVWSTDDMLRSKIQISFTNLQYLLKF